MRRSLICSLTMFALALAIPAAAQNEYVHPLRFPQPKVASEFFAVVEIPAGSSIKYEIDETSGHVFVDRFLSMAVAYPANYGSIPSSMGADGDPLDVLVLTREPIAPGVLIRVRAIGALSMIDDGDSDDKIIAVPATSIDPTYEQVTSIEDLPLMERNRIEGFFRVYKQLPDPEDAKKVELGGFRSAREATEQVMAAVAAFRNQPVEEKKNRDGL